MLFRSGMDVAFQMRGAKQVVIVDASATGAKPGTVYRVPGEELDDLPPLAEHLPDVRYTPPAATYLGWLDCRALGWGDGTEQVVFAQARQLAIGGRGKTARHPFPFGLRPRLGAALEALVLLRHLACERFLISSSGDRFGHPDPETLARLNKGFTVESFCRASEFLVRNGVGVRVFVMVQPPFQPAGRSVEWAVRSASLAFEAGASVVALIPTRTGNGAMETLARLGHFTPPSIEKIGRAHV